MYKQNCNQKNDGDVDVTLRFIFCLGCSWGVYMLFAFAICIVTHKNLFYVASVIRSLLESQNMGETVSAKQATYTFHSTPKHVTVIH